MLCRFRSCSSLVPYSISTYFYILKKKSQKCWDLAQIMRFWYSHKNGNAFKLENSIKFGSFSRLSLKSCIFYKILMGCDPITLFKNYRMATGVYLFSKKERLAWDLIFLILIFIFFIGLIQLMIGTYNSFARVFFGAVTTSTHNSVQN